MLFNYLNASFSFALSRAKQMSFIKNTVCTEKILSNIIIENLFLMSPARQISKKRLLNK